MQQVTQEKLSSELTTMAKEVWGFFFFLNKVQILHRLV